MASPNYDTASTYLNNLLLSRGLLTDGQAIPFSKITITQPGAEKHGTLKDDNSINNGNEIPSTAAGRIINLIHDLILRRDRDADHRDTLTCTIRSLHAEEGQHLLHVQKLQDKTATLKSQLNTVESQVRLYKQEIRRCEKGTKCYIEQNVKLKSALDQTRAKGISEVRVRDVELNKLKNVVAGMNRGAKREFDPRNTRLHSLKGGAKVQSGRVRSEQGSVAGGLVEDSVFGQESPEMLTALLNETSTENVALRKIVEDSMSFLTSLTDMESVDSQQQIQQNPLDEFGSAIGIPGQYRNLHNPVINGESTTSDGASSGSVALVPISTLGQEMSKVLQHCRTILKDPSFVPIEEVHVREKEIEKLKAGWERMADRWREAVGMMGSWRREVMGDQHGYEIVTMSDHLQQSLENDARELLPAPDRELNPFRRSIALRPDGRPVLDPIEEEEFTSLLEEHRSRLIERSVLSSHAGIEEISQHNVQDDSLAEPDATSTPRPLSSFHIYSPKLTAEVAQAEYDDTQSSLDPQESPHRVSAVKNLTSPARRGIRLAVAGTDTASANVLKRKSVSQFDSEVAASVKRRVQTSHALDEREHEHDSTYMSNTSAGTSTNSSVHAGNPAPGSAPAPHKSSIDPFRLSDTDSEADDPFTTEDNNGKHRMTVAEKLAAIEAEAEAIAIVGAGVANTTGEVPESVETMEPTEVIRRKQALVPDEKRARMRDRDRDRRSGGKEKEDMKKKKSGRDRRRSTLTPAELGALMR